MKDSTRSYREAVLDMFVFQSLYEVRVAEKWLKEYNEKRPHEYLGHLTPREYLLTPTTDYLAQKARSYVESISAIQCGKYLSVRTSKNRDALRLYNYFTN